MTAAAWPWWPDLYGWPTLVLVPARPNPRRLNGKKAWKRRGKRPRRCRA